MNKEIEQDFAVIVINNIPRDYHSVDLRNFFSQFIESSGFICFHFKHRPEVQICKNRTDVSATKSSEEQQENIKRDKDSNCCLAKVKSNRCSEFLRSYNKKHWLNRKGESIPSLCYISKIIVQENLQGCSSSKYKTRGQLRTLPLDRESVSSSDLETMSELNPPSNIMPNGNVGTPTSVFYDLIQQCKLPPKVISKLGLTFPKSRKKRQYDSVPFEYISKRSKSTKRKKETTSSLGSIVPAVLLRSEEESIMSRSGHALETAREFKSRETLKQSVEVIEIEDSHTESEAESIEDADECEEYERHEALYDDPANVERNKERLFEEKIELKWEKGGSGLVFYTDAQFWKAREGGFDEETADDWDVDMSGYYDAQNGGDRDARDLLSMRTSARRRDGIEPTTLASLGFTKNKDDDRKKSGSKKRRRNSSDSEGGVTDNEEQRRIGHFEKHTKGVGRRVMEKMGWTEGQGLGTGQGHSMKDALDNDGQTPSDRRGFGYHGEKLERTGPSFSKKPKRGAVISTIYDNPSELDPQEPLLRRLEPYHLKHRAYNSAVPYQAFHRAVSTKAT